MSELQPLLGTGPQLDAALERAQRLDHDGERRRYVHWIRKTLDDGIPMEA
ncbi:MAG: hypothetical protein AABY18_04775 [Candidatus Thermoplasmatota archaeon]